MKHRSIVLALAFLLLCFPVSFRAQSVTKSKAKKAQKVKRVSDEVKVKKIVEQVIDGFFVKRKFLPIFQNLFSFAPCDKIDKEILDQNCKSRDILGFKFGEELGFRAVEIGSRYMYQPFFFILGTYPIKKDSNEAYPYNDPDYDLLHSEVLKKNNFSFPDFDFTNLTKKQIEKRLDGIEQSVNQIEKSVFERINKDLYERNIAIMKETIKVRAGVEKGRKYHGVEIEGLVFSFILTKRNGQLKIVGIEDGI